MKNGEEKSINDLLDKRQGDILTFVESFIEKLSDEELIASLAEKDLEKLARVFKIVFERLDADRAREEKSSRLDAIIKAFGEIGGENKNGGE